MDHPLNVQATVFVENILVPSSPSPSFQPVSPFLARPHAEGVVQHHCIAVKRNASLEGSGACDIHTTSVLPEDSCGGGCVKV